MFHEKRIENDIERNHLPIRHEIANLPANAAAIGDHSHAIGNDLLLPFKIAGQVDTSFVRLSEVVRWRCHDQLDRAVRHGLKKILTITLKNHGALVTLKGRSYVSAYPIHAVPLH
jgi:hypothetical protein